MPYGRCVICSFAGGAQEVIEKARAGILPIFKRQSGFLAYGVRLNAGTGLGRVNQEEGHYGGQA